MAGKDTITLKVDVDAKGAASGLKPLTTALDQTKTAAEKTETELGKIGGEVGKIKINDDAIDAARKEIGRLRRQIREDLSLNIDADTSGSLKRINQLKRTIKSLDDESVELKVEAEVSGGGDIEHLGSAAALASPKVGGLLANLGKTKAVAGGVVTGIAAAAVTVGNLAGDAESARSQLDTLTGSTAAGAKAFEDLNRFANQTPYEFADVTSAASQLLSAGIDTKDLSKNLQAIGDAASAAGQPIDEVALAYSQMVSKGKVSNEEMLQLQERNIDAYGILAKKMGLTVAQVQDLASENKLGRDAVDLLRQGMEETYGGAMQRQAETLNGKLSTLGDTFKALGTNIGNSLLPMFKDLTDVGLEVGGMLDTLMDKQAEWSAQAKDPDSSAWDQVLGTLSMNSGDLIEKWKEGGVSLGEWKDIATGNLDVFERTTNQAELEAAAKAKGKEETKKAAKETAKQAEAAEKAKQAAEEHEKAIKDASDELARMATLYGEIGAGLRTKVSFIFSQADFNEELEKLTNGKEGVDLPAHLHVSDLSGLGDKQQQIVETISSSVESGLQEGARRAELNPNFDEVAWYRQIRRKTRGQLISVGVDPKDVNRILTNVFGLPRTIPVDANLNPAQQAVNDFKPGSKTLTINAEIAPAAAGAAAAAGAGASGNPSVMAAILGGGKLPAATSPIVPKVDAGAAKTADAHVDNVAAPAGKPRSAKIAAKLDGPSYRHVDARLDDLTLDRHMTIYVHTQRVGGGGAAGTGALAGVGVGGFAAPDTRTGLVATARALTATTAAVGPTPSGYAPGAQGAAAAAPAGSPAAPVKLSPRQTPVAVYLDGAEISTSLELRARQIASVGTVRRRTA